MDSQTVAPIPPEQKSPLALLDKQSQLLDELTQLQREQIGDINALSAQNERIIGLLATIADNQGKSGTGFSRVKIEDFNMPFWALAGIIIKIALASIPAWLILALSGFILWFVIAVVLIGLMGAR
jgi:hypothetical protein